MFAATFQGPANDPGINQRALQQLFTETAERGQDWHFTIEVSVLEIYNETIKLVSLLIAFLSVQVLFLCFVVAVVVFISSSTLTIRKAWS